MNPYQCTFCGGDLGHEPGCPLVSPGNTDQERATMTIPSIIVRPDIDVRGDLPDLNVPLLTDIVTWATQDEALLEKKFKDWGVWNQDVWAKQIRNGACKTACCIAGQAVIQSDFVLVYEGGWADGFGNKVYSADYCAPAIPTGTFDNKGKPIFTHSKDADDWVSIDSKAHEILGLADDEGIIFAGDNTLTGVITMAAYFMRRRGIEPDFVESVAVHDQHITDEQFEDRDFLGLDSDE